MSPGLAVRVRHEQGCAIVMVTGEVDIATVAQLRERLSQLTAEGFPLIADLDRVSFIDAAGLGALVGAARRSAEHGASLRVVCAQPQIRRLLKVTKVDGRLALARTVAEALQAVAAGETLASHTPSSPGGAAPLG
jgi:anti-sigma B factor antagonist